MKEFTEEEIKSMSEIAELDFKKEVEEMLHNKFPRFLKDFLNEFVKTKFFQKTYKSRKEYVDCYEYKVEDYYLVDWECPKLFPNNRYSDEEKIESLLNVGKFGLIPHYQHDELKAIVIDFKNKEAYLEEGLAVGLWASRVVMTKRNIPKYMQPLIDELFIRYDEEIGGKNESSN